MVALYASSHYKNTPNDLILMSDAPAHHLFALLGPVDETQVSKTHRSDSLLNLTWLQSNMLVCVTKLRLEACNVSAGLTLAFL